MDTILSTVANFFSYVFEALSSYSEVKRKLDTIQASVTDITVDLMQQINYQKAWAAYWTIAYAVNLAVYIRDSIGKSNTYCNICVYDLFDFLCNAVWKVKVRVGESLKIPMAMGNEVHGFDFDISPILKNNDPDKILDSTIQRAYTYALKAIKSGEIRQHTPKTAQYIANKYGVSSMIIHPGLGVKKIGHIAAVAPHFVFSKDKLEWELLPYDSKLGCFTGNAGWTNGMMPFSKGFGGFLNPDTLEPVVGENKCIQKPAVIVEFRDRVTGDFLSPDVNE